ncbi:MAG TPA: hypothetical protein VJT49_19550 [Amycolatopsis sp.]|uniref:DUF2017 family protein n=1 Tax=Amycolatopsis sp. TaxID=37632 RepID=UPI002B47D230|nr:hypothetical protein [Amycolatopsis sp.]HKS47261.1 hypothetical protein [Amycolatopsis sp.]
MGDFLTADPAGDGRVFVEMSAGAARCLHQVAEDLLAALAPDSGEPGLADHDLFPDAYDTPDASEDFRRRHGGGMREEVTGAVWRVATEWQGQPAFTMNRRAVWDWLITYGHAQAVFRRRRWEPDHEVWARMPFDHEDVTAHWVPYVREALIRALTTGTCG